MLSINLLIPSCTRRDPKIMLSINLLIPSNRDNVKYVGRTLMTVRMMANYRLAHIINYS